MKHLFIAALILFAPILAAEESMPPYCKSLPVTDETFIISTQKPQLVLIHNISTTDLWLTHPVSEPSASAGWSSRLQAGNWSALAVDKDFELSCIESKPGHEQQVPCKDLIAACEWTNTVLPTQQGPYWAAEDMQLRALTSHLESRSFTLPINS